MKANKNKLIQIANFLEELAWLIESNKSISLGEVSETIRNIDLNVNFSNAKVAQKYSQKNPNKQFLIGALPKLLQDKGLFKGNGEMLDFAEDVLRLKASRAAKRSRIEYIGWIVCEVSNLNDEELEHLVNALSKIINDDKKLKKMKDAKKLPNFSWNKTIQELGE